MNTGQLVLMATTAHPFDTRIYSRETVALLEAGYRVVMVGPGDNRQLVRITEHPSLSVLRLGPVHKRYQRAIRLFQIWFLSLKLKPQYIHCHDPEFVFVSMFLWRKLGKRVILDLHEDYQSLISERKWVPRCFRRVLSGIWRSCLGKVARERSVVVAGEYCASSLHGSYLVVSNYPLSFPPVDWAARKREALYAGGLSRERGLFVMIEAVAHSGSHWTLVLAGHGDPQVVAEALDFARSLGISDRVKYMGNVPFEDALVLERTAMVGLILYEPLRSHIAALPVKLWEFMSSGLAILASDFPLWRQIMTESRGGWCVDPTNARAVAESLDCLFKDEMLCFSMGRAGREYVERYRTWKHEAVKLVSLYSGL